MQGFVPHLVQSSHGVATFIPFRFAELGVHIVNRINPIRVCNGESIGTNTDIITLSSMHTVEMSEILDIVNDPRYMPELGETSLWWAREVS